MSQTNCKLISEAGSTSMKNFLTKSIAAIALCCITFHVAAQIPVTDVASLSQQIQQVTAWAQQLAQMKTQLEQQRQLYASISGSRGLGQLLNDPALKNLLPADWQQVYNAVQKGGYAGLTGAGKAIRDATAIYSCTGKTGSTLDLCNRDLNITAQNKANAQAAYDAAGKRLDNIQNLMGQIDATTDAKSIQELQTRMQAEQAMIQNEQTKLMMFKMIVESEEKLISQQKRETDMKNLSITDRTANHLTPIQFSR